MKEIGCAEVADVNKFSSQPPPSPGGCTEKNNPINGRQ